MMPRASSVLILGSGAMACLFAARLSAATVRVTMLDGWLEGLAALKKFGVRLAMPDGVQTYPVRATHNPRACVGIPYALVLVKSWQTESAARQLAECLPQGGMALTLQNGLGNSEILAQILGAERVAVGTTTAGATLEAPGLTRPTGSEDVTLACCDPNSNLEALLPLVSLLKMTGLAIHTTSNLRSLQWGKLAINTAINPLSALLNLRNGELLERPSARALMAAAAQETSQVAQALGICLPYPDPAAAAEEVARRTAGNRSSMLQDVLRRAPTEIDAICGAVVQHAGQIGMAAPINATLWRLVRALAVENPLIPGKE